MNKLKKICFPFIGNNLGGSHLSILEIIKRLDKSKFKVILLVHKKGFFYQYLRKQGFDPKFIKLKKFVGERKGIFFNLYCIFLNFFKIFVFIQKSKINIIHINDSSTGLNWVLPAKLSSAKLIWHQRVVFPKWNLYKILSYFSDLFICISDYVYKSLPKKNKEKSVKVTNPISLSKQLNDKTLLKKYFKIKNEKKILFLANIIENKRIDVFLKASEVISKRNKNIKFFIVGKDEKKIFYNFKKQNKLVNNIVYLGFSDNPNFWLQHSDLLLVTSNNEGFNRTIAEAMLAKTPIIAVNSGAHNEIIKDKFNGWLVEKNNYKEIAKVSLKVLYLKRKKINKVLDNAFKFATKEFNPKKNVKKISNIYSNT